MPWAASDIRALPAAITLAILAGWLGGCSEAAPPPASLVILNGHVQTMAAAMPTASALAIRDGRIVNVGSDEQVRPFIGAGTKVFDAAGATVLPGFIDTHMHPVTSSVELDDCSFGDDGDEEIKVAGLAPVISRCAPTRDTRTGIDWILVNNLNPASFEATREDLDKIESARPLVLSATDGHSLWLNSRALAVCGITRDTPRPEHEQLVVDGDGEPTGHLVDGAQRLTHGCIPEGTFETKVLALRNALPLLHAAGLTSVMDASVAEPELKVLAQLARNGELSMDVTTALEAEADGKTDSLPQLEDWRKRYSGLARLHVNTVKVFVDGVAEYPTQSAALLQPYRPHDGKGRSDAADIHVDPAAFGRLATELDRRGFNLHTHAIGDRAVRVSLDAFEVARKALGSKSRAHFSISHLQFIDRADWARFAALDVFASFQLFWAQPDSYAVGAVQPYFGPERSGLMYPAKGLLDNGATLVGGSDWNVSTYAPLEAIAVAMDRRDPENMRREPLGIDQAVSLDAMLRAYTVNAARMLGIDGETGTLEAGKQADIAVLDRDLAHADASTVRATRVRFTFSDGRQVAGK
ncbi:MAG: amidohydrolase [Arenimonas sp.]|nr:amidohydrolase [Arenimonas sp.]